MGFLSDTFCFYPNPTFFFLRAWTPRLNRVKIWDLTSPGWMHETSAWTWCTGKTQRDRVERAVGGWGGRSGWGIHVYPWLIHVYIWQKPLQYFKVISLQLIKKKKKKKKVKTRMPAEPRDLSSLFFGSLDESRLWERMDNVHTYGRVPSLYLEIS